MAPRARRCGALAAALAVAVLAAGCSGSSSDSSASTTTKAGSNDAATTTTAKATAGAIGVDGVTSWSTTDAAAAGFDPAKLDAAAAEAKAADSNCLLVARDGKIVGEWYWNQGAEHQAQEVFSATKSFASILVGIAQDDGDLKIDEPADTWIPQWKGTPSAPVTVRNLLSNDSGRFWSAASDYQSLVAAKDRNAYAIGLDQAAPPGTVWAYNNSAIQTLSAVIASATGTGFSTFGKDRLLDPLGMDDSEFTNDGAGNGTAFMGLHSTCRDMARFGELIRNDGAWNGEQIVSADYVAAATDKPSQDLNSAYGYLFWLNHKGPIGGALSPVTAEEVAKQKDGQMAPGAPDDLVWALGLGGQIIQIDRASRTVVVRLGGTLRGVYDQKNTARVLDAIEE